MTEAADSHAHFDHLPGPEAVHEVVARARDAGVTLIGAIGATRGLAAAEQLPSILDLHPGLFGVAGLHPHEARLWGEPARERLKALLQGCPRIRALGETGLDFHYDLSPRPDQARAFEEQVALAAELRLPLVLHVREAHAEARAVLRAARPERVLVHCFTGEVNDARWYLDQGCLLSFSGILTFRNAEAIREAARLAPLDRVLVETDSPYLAPEPLRKAVHTNEPAHVLHTLRRLAEVRGISFEEAAAATVQNTRRFFSIQ
jgi:TatD DNase family protein